MSEDTHSGNSDDDGVDGGDADVSDDGGSSAADDVQKELKKGRQRLEQEADKAVDQFDEGIVDLLSWVLDTETRARIYVYLRQHPGSTSEEIAEGTGLYPSTVREALAELTDEEKVERQKRESAGAGNNPYEYEAIAPSNLVGGIVDNVQDELNTVFNLDNYLDDEPEPETSPINITVEDEAVGDAGESEETDETAEGDEGDDVDESDDGEEAGADDTGVDGEGDGDDEGDEDA